MVPKDSIARLAIINRVFFPKYYATGDRGHFAAVGLRVQAQPTKMATVAQVRENWNSAWEM
jgi:hypothetical protein